ncbi:bax inhibitor 1-like [Solanum lycopersicum]|uniref:bax inhibitor 1-like n=1 Tax=Solanum lycopersicum TaxID=4081 RepID=UPI000E1D43C0|nr:bax inhibitor 1-like isoform X1 [Solanum lycopersicum]
MKFSVMKNAVKAYFKRDWTRQDLMDFGRISMHAYRSLNRVYLTFFCTMLSFTFGSFLHWIWEAGGPVTVISSVSSLLWLYITPPWRVRMRVLLLLHAVFNLGASSCLIIQHLTEMEQALALGLLVGSTIGIGTFWLVALITMERTEIYLGTLLYSNAVIIYGVCLYALDILDSHIAHWILVVYTLHAFFMGYLVVYSQEILYNARFGDIDFVNCTFTVFLHLPAIVVHAVRLCLGAKIQQHRRN